MVTDELFRELLAIVDILAQGDPALERRTNEIRRAMDDRRSLALIRRELAREEKEADARNTVDAVYPTHPDQ